MQILKGHWCCFYRMVIIAACLSCVHFLHAQQQYDLKKSVAVPVSTGWFWQNPLPQGNDLNSVVAFNGQNIVVAGNAGTILSTSDSGKTWNLVRGLSDSRACDFFFIFY